MDPTSRVNALLDYARHYGIADDPAARSPDSYLIDGGLDNIFPDTAPRDPHSMRELYKELESELGHYRNREKLSMTKQEGRLLARIRYHRQRDLQPDWDELLPPLPTQSLAHLRNELQLKTQEEGEAARKKAQADAAMDLGDDNTFYDREFPTFTLLEKKTDGKDEPPGSTSSESSIKLAQNQSSRSASNNSAAFVETVLAISKTDKDKTPPSNPAMLSPSIRHSSIRPTLGSIDAFMASRGVVMEPCTDTSVFNYHTPGRLATSFGGNPNTILPVRLMTPPPIPEDQKDSMQGQVLYVSSDLLKTHLPLIQALEELPNPPTLVYRDYDAGHNVEDADIIVPPMTGIILTNAQALTQRPLPGEDREYKCPVLSRIYRLAPRYEHFYVLVVSSETVDRRTADALAFLQVFCGKASDHAKVVSHKIRSEDIVGWVLAIAFERGERE